MRIRSSSPRTAAALLAVLCAATAASAKDLLAHDADSVHAALREAKPGDAVALKNGLYDGLRITVAATGREGAPVTFRAEQPGGVLITGDSCITISGKYVAVSGLVFDQAWAGTAVSFEGAERCRLTDCAFIECGSPTSAYPRIVTLQKGSRSNRVDHCYMQGNLSMGMGVRISKGDFENTHNRIDHNYYKDITRRSSNGQEAVQIGQGGLSDRTPQHTTVECNLFENASGDAEIISNKSCHNTIRSNTFRNCSAMLVLRGGSHVRVEGNFLIGCSGGIRVHDGFHTIVNNYIEGCKHVGILMRAADGDEQYTYYGPVNNCVVAHNTIINCGEAGISLGQLNKHSKAKWHLPPCGNDFINNLIVSERGTLIQDDGSHTTLWRGNIAWTAGGAAVGVQHEGIAQVDPGLKPADGLHRLGSAESPAVNPPSPDFRDVAAPIPGLEVDMEGRPRDDSPDVGANEWSDAPPMRGCLKPAEVGPTWMKGDPSVVQRIAEPKPIPVL
jgi:poly(beta-D-mannuronate) lyase